MPIPSVFGGEYQRAGGVSKPRAFFRREAFHTAVDDRRAHCVTRAGGVCGTVIFRWKYAAVFRVRPVDALFAERDKHAFHALLQKPVRRAVDAADGIAGFAGEKPRLKPVGFDGEAFADVDLRSASPSRS